MTRTQASSPFVEHIRASTSERRLTSLIDALAADIQQIVITTAQPTDELQAAAHREATELAEIYAELRRLRSDYDRRRRLPDLDDQRIDDYYAQLVITPLSDLGTQADRLYAIIDPWVFGNEIVEDVGDLIKKIHDANRTALTIREESQNR